jgi:hypothetical protein
MNWEQIQGQCRALTARALAAFGTARGNGVPHRVRKEKVLIGKFQARYGVLLNDAGKQIEGWTRWPSHRAKHKSNNEKVE